MWVLTLVLRVVRKSEGLEDGHVGGPFVGDLLAHSQTLVDLAHLLEREALERLGQQRVGMLGQLLGAQGKRALVVAALDRTCFFFRTPQRAPQSDKKCTRPGSARTVDRRRELRARNIHVTRHDGHHVDGSDCPIFPHTIP